MCLIKGKENDTCAHRWCYLAATKPKYYAIFKRDYLMNREGLISFNISRHSEVQKDIHKKFSREIDEKWILPYNSYPSDSLTGHDFEIFRQAMTSTALAVGYWPEDRDVFNKSEVEFLFIEETKEYRDYKVEGESYHEHWVKQVDVREVAVYIGEGSYHAV